MKPARFDYRSVTSADEAVALVGEHGDDAAVLAGGQSLVIDLRYRTRRPALVLDLNGAADLDGWSTTGDRLTFGALVRHDVAEHLQLDDPIAPLLHDVARHVAHPPIRARGTFCGSIAWANPVAEWCALARALDAVVVVRGPGGERRIPAESWFTGPFSTARAPDEVVVATELPLLGDGTTFGFAEHRRTHASFALVAAVATLAVVEGQVMSARIAVAGAADVPLRARRAQHILEGTTLTEDVIDEAAAAVVGEADPPAEPHSSVEYRRHVVGEMARRALRSAAAWS